MPKSYHNSRKTQQKTWRKHLIPWGVFVVLLLFTGLMINYFKNRESSTTPVPVATPSLPTREVTLYFASVDGRTLVAESRKINECQLEGDCLRDTVQALIDGPESGLAPILPAQVALRGVTVENSLVSIDFSRELISAHPGGTQSELLTIYGLADSLVVNFPHLRQVQILVEGTLPETLKGHVDLRQPINPDFSLVKEDLAPDDNMTGFPARREE